MLDLGTEGEAAWQTLRQHAEWAEGAWFGWLFVADRRIVDELVARYDRIPAPRGAALVLDLDSRTIERVFQADTRDCRAVWIVGEAPDDAAEWSRLHLLLNERRERIRRHLHGALLFVGRPEWKETARTTAPDLWSQRTVVLEFAPSPAHERVDLIVDQLPPDRGYAGALRADDPVLALRGIQRAQERGDTSAESVALTRLAAARLQEGRPGDARDQAARAVELAGGGEARARALVTLATAELALGDRAAAAVHALLAAEPDDGLSGDERADAFGRAGDILSGSGRWAEALDAFRSAERLATSLRGQVIARWSRGQAEYRLGRLPAARRTLESAAGEFRWRSSRNPGEMLALADILTTLGAVTDGLGDHSAAITSYVEAIGIYRGLIESGTGGDDVRSSLSWALRSLGQSHARRRAYTAARAAFTEALSNLDGGGGPAQEESSRTRFVLMSDLAGLASTTGDKAAAIAGYDQALDAARARVREAPTDESRLRDLILTLHRRLLIEPDDGPARVVLAQERLDVAHRRRQVVGDVPDTVTGELDARCDLAAAVADPEAIRRASAEAVDEYRERVRHEPEVSDWYTSLILALVRLSDATGDPALAAEARSWARELAQRWPTTEHRTLYASLESQVSSPPKVASVRTVKSRRHRRR